MKKKIFLVGLITLIGYYMLTYTSEDEKYRVLNEVIRDNNFFLRRVCLVTEKVEVFENNTYDFKLWDQLSVNTQKALQFFHSLKEDKIVFYKLNSDSALKSDIISDCDIENDMVYRISYPIVSSDKETVLIILTEDCNCMLGGQGGQYVFRKINGRWKIVNRFHQWIS